VFVEQRSCFIEEMARIVLKNASIPGENGNRPVCLEVVDGVITGISERIDGDHAIDLEGAVVLPGFIDIHNHGAIGIDVNEADAAGLLEIGRFLLRSGVTSWVPTIVPDSIERYRSIISAVSEAGAVEADDAAEIVGVHYEGMFSNRKVCGALRPEYFREYKPGDLDNLPSIEGLAHIFTFAPEVAGGIELAEDLIQRGWIPSIGHTSASVEDLDAAYEKGVRQVTHLFNAMTGIHHRELGVAGWAIVKEDVSCEIIADGIHVSDEILKMTLRAKGSESLMLVSDSIAPTGLGDGEYRIWEETITVNNLRTRNNRGSIAGSVITLADASKRICRLGADHDGLSRMASSNQARLLSLSDRGEVAVGKKADLVSLASNGEINFVMKSGAVIRS
jgi:N-acetylglucosamine-6-phosphate deacetylase